MLHVNNTRCRRIPANPFLKTLDAPSLVENGLVLIQPFDVVYFEVGGLIRMVLVLKTWYC